MSAGNEETIRRWVEEMWNGRQYDLCEALIAPRFVEHAHAPFSEHGPGEVDGPDTRRASMEWLLGQFPDFSMEIAALVAQRDMVAVRVVSTGTNLGAVNGVLPASGRSFRAEQTHWFRMTDGKVAEHWANRDDLTSMLQLGVVTKPRLGAALRRVVAATRRRFRRT
jgi:predicted ester cyclase